MAAKEIFHTSLFLDANLRAYYRCSSGALTTDSSPNGKTLTNINSVAEGTGLFGGGADQGTNNSNKYLKISENLGIAGNGNGTVLFWFKQKNEISSSNWKPLVIYTQTGSDRYFAIVYDYNSGTRNIRIDAAGTQTNSYNVAFGTADWHLLGFTKTSSTCYLYIDGTLRVTQSIGSSVAGSNMITFGANNGSNPSSWIMDDITVFDRTLSGTEMSNIYNGNYTERIPGVKTNWFM